ncbi:5097_t:CDS:2 [Acaulospora colombiana]|uniref:5097_t:CDS:1 n=1 Tax=Acaulospora colombiana TaxID=27376 RepID=A0ACA9KJZ8_9GLOM|nr:5097_t:CDS:2 [Acaulospora colombiana]
MNNAIKNSLDNNIPKRKCMTPTRNIDPLKHYFSAIRVTKRAINASKNNNSEDVFSRLPAIASLALRKITIINNKYISIYNPQHKHPRVY